MRTNPFRITSLLSVGVLLSACSTFRGEPVTELTRDANVNSRWRADLVTPVALGGAVQINGVGTMQPGKDGTETAVSLTIANSTPGGVHPWHVHRGQCGTDGGVLGEGSAYAPIKIGDDGKGVSSATITMSMPTVGRYFVAVHASVANAETVVACGNLAPPSM